MLDHLLDQKEIQMIIFQLGNEEYSVPITSVQEIIMPQTPTKLPGSPEWIEGVINLRGRIIPVIDGKKKFRLNTENNLAESKIIVLDVNSEIIGLIVDSVSEVVYLKTEDIEPTPIEMDENSDFFCGVGKHKNRLLILINPDRFLFGNEINYVNKAQVLPKAS